MNTNNLQDDQIDESETLKKVDDLIAQMSAANKQFSESSDSLLKELDTDADQLLEESDKIDAELTQTEKEAGDKLDTAMDKLISEEDEPKEEN